MAKPKLPPQPMLPHGLAGRIFGVLMEWLAEPNYRWVVAQLAPIAPKHYLEIGFGTGRMLELVVQRFKPVEICGVDPSELMFKKASRRLKKFRKKIKIDLRLGDVSALSWPEHTFEAVAASHNFQFWSDPVSALARIRALLAPTGRLVLVIRSHQQISKSVQTWIPNPITKSGKELEGLRNALSDAGFKIIIDESLRSGSRGIVAVCA